MGFEVLEFGDVELGVSALACCLSGGWLRVCARFRKVSLGLLQVSISGCVVHRSVEGVEGRLRRILDTPTSCPFC